MSLKKIFLLPTTQTQSKYGKEENGKRLFTIREEKEESGKIDADSLYLDLCERQLMIYINFHLDYS